MKLINLSALMIVGLAVSASAEDKLGSRNNPLKVAINPASDSKKLLDSSKPLQDCLEKKSGLFFTFSVPNDYVVVIESLGSKKVDIALPTSTSYALALAKGYAVEPILKVSRKGESSYKGMFVVHNDSKIQKIEDLAGKKVAFVSKTSGSGYLAPSKLLADKKIKVEPIFANKHDVSLSMVYQKQVDAGAAFYNYATKAGSNEICNKPDNKTCMYNDARTLLVTQYPDVFEKLKILELSEDLPNDPVVVRKDLTPEIKKAVKDGLKTCFADVGKTKEHQINNIDGAIDATDSDYKALIQLYKDLGVELK